MKLKSLAIAFLTSLLFSQFPIPVWAQTVLENVEKTGVLRVGARKNAVPFGFVDTEGNWQGYSIDLIKLIHQSLEKELGKEIELEMQEVTVDSRFESIKNNTVDLVCGATTITQERLKTTDFSIPFFMTGSQFLVKMGNIPKVDINGTLAGVRIAYIPNTTTDQIIRQIYPFAEWKPVRSRQEGLRQLNQNRVMAFASDGILLIAEVVAEGKDPDDYGLTPRVPMTTELYGCILPQNDEKWKKFVDEVVVSKENQQLQEQWFNRLSGSFPYVIRIEP
ncbi:MAG: amino acid ABC transporter substrate-binding protein [Microcystaceae cyanobacterium]